MNWTALFDSSTAPTLSSRLCLTLLHSLWQFALLAVVAWSLSKVGKRQSMRPGYLIYVVALTLGLVALPVTYILLAAANNSVTNNVVSDENSAVPVPTSGSLDTTGSDIFDEQPRPESSLVLPRSFGSADDSTTPAPATSSPTAPTSTVPAPAFDWLNVAPWIVGLYLIGVVWMFVRLIVSYIRANRLTKQARPVDTGPLLAALNRIAAGWSMRVAPALAVAEQVLIPKVVGVVRPTILLPATAITGLPLDELELILIHELAHVRRYDMWVNLGQRLAETLLFFNPALWYISRRISALREHCCDELACDAPTADQSQQQRTRYALALLHVVQLVQDRPIPPQIATLAASGRSPSELRRRICHLLDEPVREPVRLSKTGLCIISSTLLLLLTGPAIWPTFAHLAEAHSTRETDTSHADTAIGDATAPVDVAAQEQPTNEAAVQAAKTETEASEEKVTISGRIVMEDGSPATVKGWMKTQTRATTGNGYNSTEGHFNDHFSCTVQAGTTWLIHDAPGYAPAWVGPLETKPGETLDDVQIVLKTGFSEVLKVVDEQGEPIAGATLVSHPVINGNASGFLHEKTTDAQGEHLLEHLADTRYTFRLTKPGFQTLRSEPLEVKQGETLTLTMRAAQPTTGVVLNTDGTPAAGAKLRAKYELTVNAPSIGFADRGDGYWGEVLATADEQGRFELNSLTTGSFYLFVVETADEARLIVRDLQAGQSNVEIVVPNRRDLIVTLNGDLDSVQQRRGKPFLSVRQVIDFSPKSDRGSYSDLVGADVEIEPTESGGVAIFKGLAYDDKPQTGQQQVQVLVKNLSKNKALYDMNPAGDTQITIDLPEKTTEAEKKPGAEKKSESVDTSQANPAGPKAESAIKKQEQPKKGAINVHVTVEDGWRATAAVWMYYKNESAQGGTSVGGGDKLRDHFGTAAPPGKTWLYCFAPGYAPAWDGPFDVEPGVTIWSGDIVLKRGFSAPVQVVDQQGQPVVGATLVANPQFDGVSITPPFPNREKTTDAKGEVLLEHLAEIPYTFTVTKPDYQTLRSASFNMKSGETVTLKMIPGSSGTGPEKSIITKTISESDLKDSGTAPWQELTLDIHYFLKTLKENETGALLSEAEMNERLTTLLQLRRRLLVMNDEHLAYTMSGRETRNSNLPLTDLEKQIFGTTRRLFRQENHVQYKLEDSQVEMYFKLLSFIGHQYKDREESAAAQELLVRVNTPEGVDLFLKDLNDRGTTFAFTQLRQRTTSPDRKTLASAQLPRPMNTREYMTMIRNSRGLSQRGKILYFEERPLKSVADYLQTKGITQLDYYRRPIVITSTHSIQPAGWNVNLVIDGKKRWFVVPRGGEVFEQTDKPLETKTPLSEVEPATGAKQPVDSEQPPAP